MKVHVVGSVRVEETPRRSVIRLRPSDITATLKARLLIIDGGRLGDVKLDAVEAWLRSERRRLILVGTSWPTSVISTWLPVASGALVTPENLAAEVDRVERDLEAGLVRFTLSLEDWLPCPVPSDATSLRAILMLPSDSRPSRPADSGQRSPVDAADRRGNSTSPTSARSSSAATPRASLAGTLPRCSDTRTRRPSRMPSLGRTTTTATPS